MSEKVSTCQALEQFTILAKTVKGNAAVELIKQALEAPGVYVFGELLDNPNMQELSNGPMAPYFNLLNLFAYGVYSDYLANKTSLPELSPIMQKKLRQLTVVSLATKNKCIPYSTLQEQLDIRNVRDLEDLIIEVIYADIIRGKLDQVNRTVEVDYAIGRDIRPEALTEIASVLSEWCSGCETVLKGIEQQIDKANRCKDAEVQAKQKTETEVANIKKTLKQTQQSDGDEHMVTDSREAVEKSAKKAGKTKGLRGSGKLWGKSS